MTRKRSREASLETCIDKSVEEPSRSKRCLSIPFLLSAPVTASKCFVCWDDISLTSPSTESNFSCWYCSTLICSPCLANYANVSTNDCSILPLRCVQGNCRAPIPPPILREVLSADCFTQLMRFYSERFGNANVGNLNDQFTCLTQTNTTAAVNREHNGRQSTVVAAGVGVELNCSIGTQQNEQNNDGGDSTNGENSSKDDAAMKRLIASQGWQRCPHCGICVERTSGCDHIECTCGKEFCYQCGGVWHNNDGLGCTRCASEGLNHDDPNAPLGAAVMRFTELRDEFWLRVFVLLRAVRDNQAYVGGMNNLFGGMNRFFVLPPPHRTQQQQEQDNQTHTDTSPPLPQSRSPSPSPPCATTCQRSPSPSPSPLPRPSPSPSASGSPSPSSTQQDEQQQSRRREERRQQQATLNDERETSHSQNVDMLQQVIRPGRRTIDLSELLAPQSMPIPLRDESIINNSASLLSFVLNPAEVSIRSSSPDAPCIDESRRQS